MLPGQAANIARSLKIPIYTIDAGGEVASELEAGQGGTMPNARDQRQKGILELQNIAKITDSQYFQARDTRSLLDVCRQIDRMERTETLSFQYRRYFEAFPWLGLMSFAMLVGVSVLEMTVWRRLP
jgi:Ca-activated chloride channel family protein